MPRIWFNNAKEDVMVVQELSNGVRLLFYNGHDVSLQGEVTYEEFLRDLLNTGPLVDE